MSRKIVMKPIAVALGAAFATSLAGTSVASVAENPFAMTELASGYMVADSHMPEGKCGEGKCGESKTNKEGTCGEGKMKKEGKCGEGKCGTSMMDGNSDGKVTKDEFMSSQEKIFSKKDKDGDGVLSADEMKMMDGKCGEGKCGGDKVKKEGKCGEGKCGGNK